jgi:hypothetical protein
MNNYKRLAAQIAVISGVNNFVPEHKVDDIVVYTEMVSASIFIDYFRILIIVKDPI